MPQNPAWSRLCKKPLSLAVLLCALGMPMALAQDNSAGDCEANKGEDPKSCPVAGELLDWTPRRQVPPELQDDQCRRCDGRYIYPLRDVYLSVPREISDII